MKEEKTVIYIVLPACILTLTSVSIGSLVPISHENTPPLTSTIVRSSTMVTSSPSSPPTPTTTPSVPTTGGGAAVLWWRWRAWGSGSMEPMVGALVFLIIVGLGLTSSESYDAFWCRLSRLASSESCDAFWCRPSRLASSASSSEVPLFCRLWLGVRDATLLMEPAHDAFPRRLVRGIPGSSLSTNTLESSFTSCKHKVLSIDCVCVGGALLPVLPFEGQ